MIIGNRIVLRFVQNNTTTSNPSYISNRWFMNQIDIIIGNAAGILEQKMA